MRDGPGRRRAHRVRTVPGEAPRVRPRPLCGGQGSRQTLWRRKRGSETAERPRQEQAAPAGAARGGALHPVRRQSACRGRDDLRAVPRASARRRNGSQYEERRAAGLCTRCGGPVFDGLSRCGPCTVIDERSRSPERKNARSRRLYAERRDRGQCTELRSTVAG